MNRCLHCALFETLLKWGSRYGEGGDERGRFATLDQGRLAIATLLGDIIAGSLPISDSDSIACRVQHVAMARRETQYAIVACDMANAQGAQPDNNNESHTTH